VIKASIVLALVLVAESVLRRRSAAVRHWVLACALVCAALMPVLELVAPRWSAPIDIPWLASRAGASSFAFGDTDSGRWAGASDAGASPAGTAGSWTAASALRAAWLAGVIVGLAVLGIGLRRLASIVSSAHPLSGGVWWDALTELAGGPVPVPVRLLHSDHPALLFTWGLRRPAIVLPQSAPDWPAERIRAVLGHELAHVRRRDWVVQMAAGLARCAYWFNPLVWLACHRLRQTGEHACDDAVLNAGMTASTYAAHVLDIARMFARAQGRPQLPVMTMLRPSRFERRVRAMLDSRIDRSPLSRRSGLSVAAALLIATIPVAGLVARATSIPHEDASAAMVPAVLASPGSESTSPQRAVPAPATSLTGTVFDASGKAVPDVVVDVLRVDAPGGPQPRVRTFANGRFEMTGLPPGEYEVASSKPGFRKDISRVSLKAGAAVAANVVLQIGSLSETITVATGVASGPAPSAPVRNAVAEPPRPDPCDNSPVGGCVTPPRKLVNVAPVYPPALAAKKAAAEVVVKATLRTDGFLGDFRPEAGPDSGFVEAVIDAVHRWQFTPVKLNGVPQECQVTVTVKFVAR
jgi:beta-lactamase regulating signal transducer with metallopeptidase domain